MHIRSTKTLVLSKQAWLTVLRYTCWRASCRQRPKNIVPQKVFRRNGYESSHSDAYLDVFKMQYHWFGLVPGTSLHSVTLHTMSHFPKKNKQKKKQKLHCIMWLSIFIHSVFYMYGCKISKSITAAGSHYPNGLDLSVDDLRLKMFIWILSPYDGSLNPLKTTLYHVNQPSRPEKMLALYVSANHRYVSFPMYQHF